MIEFIVSICILGLIYSLMGMGLNLQFGHTGLINFGHVAFFAIGAYTSALLTINGIPLVLGMILAGVAAGVLAYPIGRLTVRLKTDYLAIVTLAVGEIINILLINWRGITGGSNGITNVPELFGFLNYQIRPYIQLLLLLVVVLIVLYTLKKLSKSSFGLVLWSIRENETASESIGKNTTKYKTQSFIIGAFITGIAGSFYAHYITFVVPDQYLAIVTFYIWIGIIMGGTSHFGALIGSFLLIVLMQSTRFLPDLGVPISGTDLASIRFIIIGVAIILLLRFKPDGLFPLKKSDIKV